MRNKFEELRRKQLQQLQGKYIAALQAPQKEVAESGDLSGALKVREEVLRVQTALVDSALDAPLAPKANRSPLVIAPERRGRTIDMLPLIDVASDGKPPQKWALQDGVLQCLQMHRMR